MVTIDGELISGRHSMVRVALLLAGLVGTVYAVSVVEPGLGGHGRQLVALVCTVAAGLGWLGWIAATTVLDRPLLLLTALAMLSVGGGVLAGLQLGGPGMAFCGVGLFSAAAIPAVPQARAVVLAGSGVAALFLAAAATGGGVGPALGVGAGLFAITLGGFNRRQFRTRLAQAEQLAAQTVRTQQEQARAAALAERARIAREIHDVLAHSLGAMAVQLDVADALLTDGRDPERARGHVTRARRLAVDGLTETRRAISALRGDPLPLPDLLAALVDTQRGDTGGTATLTVHGTPRPLPVDVALATYRAAQEALSNARKHAAGAPVTVELAYRHDELVLTVRDQPGSSHAGTERLSAEFSDLPAGSPWPDAGRPSESPAGFTEQPAPGAPRRDGLAGTGGGYGLTGLGERAELIGGVLTAGPDHSGWTLRLRLPG